MRYAGRQRGVMDLNAETIIMVIAFLLFSAFYINHNFGSVGSWMFGPSKAAVMAENQRLQTTVGEMVRVDQQNQRKATVMAEIEEKKEQLIETRDLTQKADKVKQEVSRVKSKTKIKAIIDDKSKSEAQKEIEIIIEAVDNMNEAYNNLPKR